MYSIFFLRQIVGKDVCGVCFGDNSTCTKCSGIPNSGKELDLCGRCLLPTDPLFNTNCTQLGAISDHIRDPTAIPRRLAISIQGVGLSAYDSVACQFVKDGIG